MTRRNNGVSRKSDSVAEETIGRKVYDMYNEQLVTTLENLLINLIADDTEINCGRISLFKPFVSAISVFFLNVF